MKKRNESVLTTVFRSRSNGVLAGLLIIFLATFISITVATNYLSKRDEQYLEHTGELRVLSQELAKNAVEAAGGKREAFTELKTARDNFELRWGYLTKGDDEANLSPAEYDAMANLDSLWQKVKNNSDQIGRAHV